MPIADLALEETNGSFILAGLDAPRFGFVNEYLSYLSDRNYSPKTVRVYGFGLLAFCRWLDEEDIVLQEVTTDTLLKFFASCRQHSVSGRPVSGRPGPNVVGMDGRRIDRLSPATINNRLAAISGLFAFRAMRDPNAKNPVPRGREARWLAKGESNGLLAHTRRCRATLSLITVGV